MLKPVKTSTRDKSDFIGFAHFKQDAERMLGARAKEYDIRLPFKTDNVNEAWDESHRLQQSYTDWIKENMGHPDPRGPAPRVIALPDKSGGGWGLMLDFFLLARDIPVGRSVKEALEAPIAHHPRTRRRKLFYQSKTPVYKTTVDLPKSYVKKSTAEKHYRALILSDAVRLEKREDGRYHGRLTYWKLDPVQLPRDIPPAPQEHDNFDLWGNWKVEQNNRAINGVVLIDDVDEGSGVGMGRQGG